jgi:predicted RND superfamily exporter protein
VGAVAAYGAFHTSVDRDLRDIFRSDSESYEAYVTVAEAFADPENQVLVLVEGAGIRSPEGLQQLLEFHLETQILPDAGAVFSLFSLRTPPDEGGTGTPLLADTSLGLTPEIIDQVRRHPIAGSSLLSADGDVALISVTHAEGRAELADLERLIEAIDEVAARLLTGLDLTATVTGIAPIRAEIVEILQRDQLVLNGAGILIGFILSLAFFRSWTASLMTALPAALAGFVLIGWTAVLGVPVTMVSNVVPILVMVLGYADGMHLSAAWRRRRLRGASPGRAEAGALIDAAAPCMLTALTMAVAFLSMTISDVGMVRDFGLMGAAGTVIGTWIVLAGHAVCARFVGRFWRLRPGARIPLEALGGPVERITKNVVRFAWPIAIISVPLTIGLGVLFLSVAPEYSVRETLPAGTPATEALSTIDRSLGGAYPVHVVVEMSDPAEVTADELGRVRSVHEATLTVPGVQSVFSIWSMALWLDPDGAVRPDITPVSSQLTDFLDEMSPESVRRFLAHPGALVTVNIPERSTAETLDLIAAIEVAALAADPSSIVTGPTVIAAREGTRAIFQLNSSLGLAIVGGLLLIALAMRSPAIAAVAFLPNILPDMAAGALLHVVGNGMQLTSIVALTIAFGIAVDDTIHYLSAVNRMSGPIGARIVKASRRVGPVLAATTAIIGIGNLVTLTSGLTTVVLFGAIVVTSLVMALIADLVLLPAIATGPARRWFP